MQVQPVLTGSNGRLQRRHHVTRSRWAAVSSMRSNSSDNMGRPVADPVHSTGNQRLSQSRSQSASVPRALVLCKRSVRGSTAIHLTATAISESSSLTADSVEPTTPTSMSRSRTTTTFRRTPCTFVWSSSREVLRQSHAIACPAWPPNGGSAESSRNRNSVSVEVTDQYGFDSMTATFDSRDSRTVFPGPGLRRSD